MIGVPENPGIGAKSADVAATSHEARERPHKPDLIIADLHLDNGELGFEAIRRFQDDIEALIVTADHSEGVTATASTLGLEVLPKPAKPAESRSLMAYPLA